MKKSAKQRKRRSTKKVKVQKALSHVPDKLRKMIAEDVQRYLMVLGMNHYRSKVFYMKKDIEHEGHSCEEGRVAAAANVDMRYLSANIRIYPYMVDSWKEKNMDDEDVHEIIAHEVAHIATHHMFRLATSVYKDEGETKDAWESLTTVVGRLAHEVDKRRRGFKKTNEK